MRLGRQFSDALLIIDDEGILRLHKEDSVWVRLSLPSVLIYGHLQSPCMQEHARRFKVLCIGHIPCAQHYESQRCVSFFDAL